ncbi:MAG: spore germination protein [Eubacteriales bacterium]
MKHEQILAVFQDCGDFVWRKLNISGQELYYYCIDGMTAGAEIGELVLRPTMQDLTGDSMEALYENALGRDIYAAVVKPAKTVQEVVNFLVNGFTILLFPSVGAISIETKSPVKRLPAPPQVENTVKGAKDAFTETMRINTTLIRYHMRSPDLRIFQTVVGKDSLTNVSVVWLKGKTSENLVEMTKNRINSMNIDGLITPSAVEEYISGTRTTPFPLVQYTERADRFATALLAGRVGILVDGLPVGYLVPVDLGRLMESTEDTARDYVTATALRALRYFALMVSLLLPALYVAMATYHPEMLPTKLLLSIITSKENVPFPTILEVIFLLLAFEILQEAGLQLPQSIGQSVSIIGGLVVGSAAVEAQIISPAALIAVAVAGICGFALPQRDFANAIRLCRFGLTILASLAGLVGVVLGFMALVGHLAGLTSYGKPYLAPFSDLEGGDAVVRRRFGGN